MTLYFTTTLLAHLLIITAALVAALTGHPRGWWFGAGTLTFLLLVWLPVLHAYRQEALKDWFRQQMQKKPYGKELLLHLIAFCAFLFLACAFQIGLLYTCAAFSLAWLTNTLIEYFTVHEE